MTEARREYNRAYYERNKTHIQAKNTAYYKKRQRDLGLRKRYGITEAEYDRRYADQNGRCLICERQQHRLDVDHCHSTGKIRGLLCRRCNLRAGFLEGPLVEETKRYLQRAEE
jgi:hypothetical protein